MNANSDTTPAKTPFLDDQTQETDDLHFDEKAFVRSARAKSARRTVALAMSVVLGALVLLVGAWMAWNTSIQGQSNRISSYQYELIALSQPNTFISGTGLTDMRFPGARNTYTAYRPVGGRPMPRGDVTIDFDIWGGEVTATESGLMSWQSPSREFSGAQMAPALRFLYPLDTGAEGSGSGSMADASAEVQQLAAWTMVARERLDAAPTSATAELAVSFKTRKTLSEVEALLPKRLILNWGVVDVWTPGQGPVTTMDGSMVGITFVGPDGSVSVLPRAQLEKDLVDDLRFVAEYAPSGTADRCLSSASFIDKNGVSYFGVVVTGPVSEVRKLLDLGDVSSATLGFVIEPWE